MYSPGLGGAVLVSVAGMVVVVDEDLIQTQTAVVFKSPVQFSFLAPKQCNRTRTSPRKFPSPGNWQLDWKKPVLNGPYISCNQLQPVF